MPESMDVFMEDSNLWTMNSFDDEGREKSAHHIPTRGTIIGPEKTWGKFVFTPMFVGLVEEIHSPLPREHLQQQQQQTREIQYPLSTSIQEQKQQPGEMARTTKLLDQPTLDKSVHGQKDTQVPQVSENHSNIVTPLRSDRRLQFYSSSSYQDIMDLSNYEKNVDSPMTMTTTTTRIIHPFQEELSTYNQQEVAVVHSPRPPPTISRLISSHHVHHSPFLARGDQQQEEEEHEQYLMNLFENKDNYHQDHDDSNNNNNNNNNKNSNNNQLNVLVQAVDLVTIDSTTGNVYGKNDDNDDDDDTTNSPTTTTRLHPERLRDKRNRRLRPTWN